MNSTELASLLFHFDPNADRIVFYATTIAYSITAMWNVITISYRLSKKCVQLRCAKHSIEPTSTRLVGVSVIPPNEPREPQTGHEIRVE